MKDGIASGLFAAVIAAIMALQYKNKNASNFKAERAKKSANKFAIIVHGGAYAIPNDVANACEVGCRKAAAAGYAILSQGGTALDAVEAAVIELENNPVFDAGYGSVLTSDSTVEMDALIIDGATLNAGAVACISHVRNPISVARKVMQTTNHSLIVGAGADAFAESNGFEYVTTDQLTTDATRAELATYMKESNPYGATVMSAFNGPTTTATTTDKPTTDTIGGYSDVDGDSDSDSDFGGDYVAKTDTGTGHDTTGCVAIDINGNICAGTSTGGITAKIAGRVGDSPIIGSGAYADNYKGGVSTTGHGESIMKMCIAKNAVDIMFDSASTTTSASASASNTIINMSPRKACAKALKHMYQRVGGCGGMICINPQAQVGKSFSTSRMSWASIECICTSKSQNDNGDGIEDEGIVHGRAYMGGVRRLSGVEIGQNNVWL